MAIVDVAVESSNLVLHPAKAKEMLSTFTLPDGRTKVRINFSSMDIIQNCLRKAKYALHEKWKAQDEAAATVFGSAFHKALEVYYSGALTERKLPKLETLELMSYGNLVEGEKTDLLLRAARAFIDAAKVLSPLPETDKHSIQNGVWILHCYFKSYLDDPYVAHTDESGSPYIERTFSLVVYEDAGLVIELFGTLDVILKHVITGEIIPADHKTAGFLSFNGSSYFDREKPSHQYTGYLLGAREVFGIDSKNFLVNIIEKKAKPKTEKAKGVSFPRQITERNADDFTEFTETLVYVVRQYLTALETDVWPLGPVGACTAYGACTYRAVCSAPKSIRDTILNGKFIKGVTI
jgi:hypothetical protein